MLLCKLVTADLQRPERAEALQGLERALENGATEVAIFAAATDTFSSRNTGCTVHESLTRYRAVAKRARDAGVQVRGYISCVLGCPYEVCAILTLRQRIQTGHMLVPPPEIL